MTNTKLNASGGLQSDRHRAFQRPRGPFCTDLPNTRTISNLVVAGNGDVPNAEGLSGMMYAWGQFIDHDINLTLSDNVNHIDISIPAGDRPEWLDLADARRHRSADRCRRKAALTTNNVTGWLDGSMVLRSDAATAASLRSADGHPLTRRATTCRS